MLRRARYGDNRTELSAAGTWTGSYRVTVTGADLVLDEAPSLRNICGH